MLQSETGIKMQASLLLTWHLLVVKRENIFYMVLHLNKTVSEIMSNLETCSLAHNQLFTCMVDIFFSGRNRSFCHWNDNWV